MTSTNINYNSLDTELLTTPGSNTIEEMLVSRTGKLLARTLETVGFRASMNQIEAYNEWIDNGIPRQVESMVVYFGDRKEYMLKFGPTIILPPMITIHEKPEPLTPAKALLYGVNYMAEVRTHFTLIKNGNPDDPCSGEIIEQSTQPIHIGSIPCMLKSKICHLYGKSPEELDALGSDRREPGGYYIVGHERLFFYPEKIRTNTFILGMTPKKGFKYVNLTASTPKGSVVTTITAIPDKSKVNKSIISLTLNNLKEETKTGKTVSQAFNIFKIIRLYVGYKRDILGSDKVEYYQNPYNLQHIVMNFIQPSRRSKCKTMLSDTVVDSFIKMNNDEGYLSDLIKKSREKYLNRISKKKGMKPKIKEMNIIDSIVHSIESSLLSHEDHTNPERVVYSACMMVGILCEFMAGFTHATDKDEWGKKRLDCSALQCEQLFRGFWKNACDFISKLSGDEKKKSKPTIESLKAKIARVNMGDSFNTSFTSTWGLGTVNVSETNPTQILQQETFDDKISMLSHTIANVDKKVKNHKVRSTQPSQWGIIDPAATSENASVGLNKKMAILTHVTIAEDPTPIIDIITGNIAPSGFPLKNYNLYPNPDKTSSQQYLQRFDNEHDTTILVNGMFKGWCNGPELLKVMIAAKRENIIPRKTSIVHNKLDRYLTINCDAGRCVQPLLIVENNKPVIDTKGMWESPIMDLFDNGCMEFIDAAEIVKVRVAPDESFLEKWENDRIEYSNKIAEYSSLLAQMEGDATKAESISDLKRALNNAKYEYNIIISNPYTHMMIHPQALFEPTLVNMVFLGFTQAPRITYQSQMGKQSIGVYHSAHDSRFDNDAKVLMRPVKPIVGQQLEKQLFLERYQRGAQLSCAFVNLTGQTQEDAFIMSKRLVEFGVLDISHYFVVTAEISTNERLIRPPPRQGETEDSYQFLTTQGLPMINAPLDAGDFVIGKEYIDPKTGERRNTSIQLKMGEFGIVDTVFVSTLGTTTMVKVKLRRNRTHHIGDKESSRYAQKGTTSEILDHVQMPYDELTGERPSMIINTHSVPKRMTIGYLIEPLVSIVSLLTGRRYNGSPFEKPDLDEAYRIMKSFGFDASGYRWMRDPNTGLRYKAMVFMGPLFIQILRHLGKEKLQVRANGVVRLLTGQPPRGSRYGGRRIGEMERTALLSHGAANSIVSILVEMSDLYEAPFCKSCGDFAVINVDRSVASCRACENSKIVKVKIPYVYKVIVQTLVGAGISIRFEFDNFEKVPVYEHPTGDDEDEDIDLEGKEAFRDDDPEEPEGVEDPDEAFNDIQGYIRQEDLDIMRPDDDDFYEDEE